MKRVPASSQPDTALCSLSNIRKQEKPWAPQCGSLMDLVPFKGDVKLALAAMGLVSVDCAESGLDTACCGLGKGMVLLRKHRY